MRTIETRNDGQTEGERTNQAVMVELARTMTGKIHHFGFVLIFLLRFYCTPKKLPQCSFCP